MALSSSHSLTKASRGRTFLALYGILLLVLLWALPSTAFAASSGERSEGQELTVLQSEDLDPEGTEDAATPADEDAPDSGTPPEFWIWMGLAAAALIGAFTVIAAKVRRVREQENGNAASDSTDGPGSDDRGDPFEDTDPPQGSGGPGA